MTIDALKAAPRRIGWLIILVATLWVSGWSLYWVARSWGVPWQVAICFSACWDGVALLAADYALQAVKDGASDRWPRTLVMIFAGLSAFLNSGHATLAGEPSLARLAWAGPPVAAAIAYDLHTRTERRKALARHEASFGKPMPKFMTLTWLLFPLATLNAFRAIAERRTIALSINAMPTLPAGAPQTLGELPGHLAKPAEDTPRKTAAPRAPKVAPKGMPRPNVTDIREARLTRKESLAIRHWARSKGYKIGDRGLIHKYILEAYYKAHQPQDDEEGVSSE